MIAYNEAVYEEVTNMLKELKIESYTKWVGVKGKGKKGGTHLGTHIFPGENEVLMLALNTEDALKVMGEVSRLREEIGSEGIKTFSWTIDEST